MHAHGYRPEGHCHMERDRREKQEPQRRAMTFEALTGRVPRARPDLHPFHFCQGSSFTEPTRSQKARVHLDVRSVSLQGWSPGTLICWGKGGTFQPSHPFVLPPRVTCVTCVTYEPLLALLSAHPFFPCASMAFARAFLTVSSSHSCPTQTLHSHVHDALGVLEPRIYYPNHQSLRLFRGGKEERIKRLFSILQLSFF